MQLGRKKIVCTVREENFKLRDKLFKCINVRLFTISENKNTLALSAALNIFGEEFRTVKVEASCFNTTPSEFLCTISFHEVATVQSIDGIFISLCFFNYAPRRACTCKLSRRVKSNFLVYQQSIVPSVRVSTATHCSFSFRTLRSSVRVALPTARKKLQIQDRKNRRGTSGQFQRRLWYTTWRVDNPPRSMHGYFRGQIFRSGR